MRVARLPAIATAGALLFSVQASVPAAAASPLVIGVDHADPANQIDHGFGSFTPGRVFEYTDFFARHVIVHSGDTLDFRTAPSAFHVIGLATHEKVARAVYPVAFNDEDTDLAPGSGAPKIVLGPSNFPIQGGSTSGGGVQFGAFFPNCGLTAIHQPVCTFSGGTDIEAAGGLPGIDLLNSNFNSVPPKIVPGQLDWSIQINAAPGTYDYFCFIHPGMRGSVEVVPPGEATTTQSEVDTVSAVQFKNSQREALKAEAAANVVQFTVDAAGLKTFQVHVGIGAAQNHVAVSEMLPATTLNLAPGDKVDFLWSDPHNAHSATFPTWGPNQPGPFVFDCLGKDDVVLVPPTPPRPAICGEPPPSPAPELIADPGNSRPGRLTDTAALVDSGVLVGTDLGLSPSAQSWSVVATSPGSYRFQCMIHDWMQGTINVGS
jgi:plastocyanin